MSNWNEYFEDITDEDNAVDRLGDENEESPDFDDPLDPMVDTVSDF